MKKGIALTVAMLVSLPSCRCPKKKREPKKMVMKKEEVDLFSTVSIPLADAEMVEDEKKVALHDDDTIQSFFEEETGEFESKDDLDIAIDNDNIAMGNDNIEEQKDFQDSLEEFSWVEDTKEAEEEEFKAVYFDFDGKEVRADQEASVTSNVQQIKQELKIAEKTGIEPTLVVEGHACHSAGSPSYNLALSEKRAKQVSDRFVDAGIERDSIKVVGRGQDVPAIINNEKVTGSREEQWANRRVEVRVTYT